MTRIRTMKGGSIVMLRTTSLALVFALAASAAQAQSPKFKVARNAFGQPDITGTWTNATTTPFERPAEFKDQKELTDEQVARVEGRAVSYRQAGMKPTDPNAGAPTDKNTDLGYNRGWTDPGTSVMRVAGKPRSSMITTTKDGRVPPRRPGAPPFRPRVVESDESSSGAGQSDHPETRGITERCIHFPSSAGPVMRPVLYNNNFHIQQGRDSVAIWVEMIHDVKIIRIGGKHRNDGVREWLGDSIGRYEGDTLVVETKDYHPMQTFFGASDKLKVTERFTPVAKDRLLYQFTVEDPVVWEEAWGGEYEFYTSPGIYEYACHEGNIGLEGILAGAREDERRAAEAAKR